MVRQRKSSWKKRLSWEASHVKCVPLSADGRNIQISSYGACFRHATIQAGKTIQNRYLSASCRIPNKSALQKRISSLDASSQEKESTLGKLNFTPITSLRYSDYLQKDEIVISFNYIRYFAMAGVLVIVYVHYSII